jgi:hypothetical protein
VPRDDPVYVQQVEIVGDAPGLGPDLAVGVATAYSGEDQLELVSDPVAAGAAGFGAAGAAGLVGAGVLPDQAGVDGGRRTGR